MADIGPLALPLALAALYAIAPGAVSRRRGWAFAWGISAVAVALAPPVDTFAERSLCWHMTQHVLLLAVAPPLLVASGALARWRSTLPDALRSPSLRWTPTAAVAALCAHTAAMVAWHVPSFYDTAERVAPLHGLEHITFLAAGVAFWAAAMSPASQLSGPLLLFVGCLPGTALGVALTFASGPWYRAYPDVGAQQLAGVVMWAGAGTVYLVGAAVLTLRALGDADSVDRQPIVAARGSFQ